MAGRNLHMPIITEIVVVIERIRKRMNMRLRNRAIRTCAARDLITLFSDHEFTKLHRWLYKRFCAVAQWMEDLSNREALE